MRAVRMCILFSKIDFFLTSHTRAHTPPTRRSELGRVEHTSWNRAVRGSVLSRGVRLACGVVCASRFTKVLMTKKVEAG